MRAGRGGGGNGGEDQRQDGEMVKWRGGEGRKRGDKRRGDEDGKKMMGRWEWGKKKGR